MCLIPKEASASFSSIEQSVTYLEAGNGPGLCLVLTDNKQQKESRAKKEFQIHFWFSDSSSLKSLQFNVALCLQLSAFISSSNSSQVYLLSSCQCKDWFEVLICFHQPRRRRRWRRRRWWWRREEIVLFSDGELKEHFPLRQCSIILLSWCH